MKRVRFYIGKESCKGDYRPVKWPPEYPYWCAGENDSHFVLISYTESVDELMELWPEAEVDEVEEASKVEFTSRFPKPNWYNEEQSKKLK